MHIKVQFVNSYIGIAIDQSTTALDLIKFILLRNMIPAVYANVCVIIRFRQNYGSAMLLSD